MEIRYGRSLLKTVCVRFYLQQYLSTTTMHIVIVYKYKYCYLEYLHWV